MTSSINANPSRIMMSEALKGIVTDDLSSELLQNQQKRVLVVLVNSDESGSITGTLVGLACQKRIIEIEFKCLLSDALPVVLSLSPLSLLPQKTFKCLQLHEESIDSMTIEEPKFKILQPQLGFTIVKANMDNVHDDMCSCFLKLRFQT